MEDPFESQFDPELIALVRQYEDMINHKEHQFFDVFEYEDIIDYYIYLNDLPSALMCLKKALRQHQNNPLILLKQVQYLIHTKKDREALNLLEELDQSEGTDSDFHLQKGNLYSQLERSEKAIQSYKNALKDGDAQDDIYVSLAFEYENLGKYNLAIKYLTEAIKVNPENEAALFEISFCFEITRQSEKCIAFFRSFLDEHPYSKVSWFNLGVAYGNMEEFDKSIEAYDFALAIDESFSSAYFNKANCFANAGLFEKAIQN